MTTLTKRQATKADHFLRQLCDPNIKIGPEKVYSLFNGIDETHEICEHIESRGFIKITVGHAEKRICGLTLLPNACLFIRNGGFTKEFKSNHSETIWKRAPIFISCVSLFFVGVSLYRNYGSDQKISTLETEISKHDSLIQKHQILILQAQKELQDLTDSLILFE